MQVILLKNVRKLGGVGDKVNIKPGYGRNYLIPQKKAVYATSANIELFEQRRAELEKEAQQDLEHAQKRAAAINDLKLVIQALASDEGKLYGSVGINEIKEALDGKSVEVSKREIIMPDGPLHSVGEYTIEIHVHSDVVASLSVEVIATK